MQCQLIEGLFDVLQAIREEQCVARDYGDGTPLYHAEVSLLDIIHRHPDHSAAQLAETLGITRGALTQTAKKLMEKGLITQYHLPNNRKTKYHQLTDAGEAVRQGHAQFHEEANTRMRAYLCTRSAAEKQVLMDFFKVLDSCKQLCLYDCEATGCGCGLSGADSTHEQGGTTDVGA